MNFSDLLYSKAVMTVASRLIASILLIAVAVQPLAACWMNSDVTRLTHYQAISGANKGKASSLFAGISESGKPDVTLTAQEQDDTGSPPCHNTADTNHSAPGDPSLQGLEQIPCAQCGDCDTVAVLVQPNGDKHPQNLPVDDVPAVTPFSALLPVKSPVRVRILGPPETAGFEHKTPITLKQRLLV